MGFSVKLAPGVRVRASSRGLRTSIGPRAARLHVGAGRAGFSTGAGPVGYYTSLGGGSSAGRRAGSTGSSTRGLAAAAKAQQAAQLAAAITTILDLHRAEFPLAQPPVAPPAPPVDEALIRARHRKEALAGVGLLDRGGRARAKQAADRAAAAEAHAVAAQRARAVAQYQRDLDQWWSDLVSNEPATVLAALAEAFEDNEAAAAGVGVDGAEASVVVVVPPASDLPERLPTTTPAGNLSLKRLTKRESADLYKLMVCGYVLATVKEALAVAPGITSARVVALRRCAPDAYGRVGAEAILATRLRRAALTGVQWATADSALVLNTAGTETLVRPVGPSKELGPLDLSSEPELRALVDAVDLSELID